jgi:acid phosphatase (class A)
LYLSDRAIFRATRALAGTPRWAMAQSDSNFTAANLMTAFSCSSGLVLDAQRTPRFAAMASKLLADTMSAMNPPKNKYQAKRPFQIEDGPTCVSPATVENSADYPSGHAIFSWTVGSILAELEPDRATGIMVRARAFGESRVVCGLHNASAVEGGRIIATAMVAALHGSATFRADLETVRTELAALRAAASTKPPASCATEAAALAANPY